MQPETKFKNRIDKKLRAIPNSWWVKTQMVAVRGIPDYLGVVSGRFVALELKKDEQSARRIDKLQEYILGSIRKAGGIAEVVYPDVFDKILQSLNQLSGEHDHQNHS